MAGGDRYLTLQMNKVEVIAFIFLWKDITGLTDLIGRMEYIKARESGDSKLIFHFRLDQHKTSLFASFP